VIRRRTFLPATIALGIAGALAGCTPGPAPTPSASEDPVVTAYRTTVTGFPLALPSGVSFPDDPPSGLLGGQGQPGAGEGAAYYYWLCAWEADYLTAQGGGDAARTSAALDSLAKWPDTSYVTTYVSDPDHGWRTTVLEPAQRGDPSGVESDIDGNGCENFGIGAAAPTPG
jgi:hypothetical protein